METTNVKKMVNEQIAETAEEAARLRDAVIHAIEDGIEDARRVAKRGKNIATEMIDDAEANVRHHPLGTVGVATLGAFIVGGLVGFLLGRKR